MSLTINLKGIDGVIATINKAATQTEAGTHKAIATFVKAVETDAKRDAPANEGNLRRTIFSDVKGLKGTVTVTANYGAYLEFGTRKFAKAYVATLPADWQVYAATFKGKGGGTFADFIKDIMKWVQLKGIGGIQTKSGNVSKSKNSVTAQKQAAYAIALSILQNGIRPHPYLYPNVKKHTPKLISDIKNLYQ